MKKLEEYETPETEKTMAILESLGFKEKGWYATGKLAEHSRDLERKLAMCRDVLKQYDDAFCDGPENCGYLRFEEIYEQARITLESTEPK